MRVLTSKIVNGKKMFLIEDKVNRGVNKYINVKPNVVSDHFEYFENGRTYPEMKYKKGGKIKIIESKIKNNF